VAGAEKYCVSDWVDVLVDVAHGDAEEVEFPMGAYLADDSEGVRHFEVVPAAELVHVDY